MNIKQLTSTVAAALLVSAAVTSVPAFGISKSAVKQNAPKFRHWSMSEQPLQSVPARTMTLRVPAKLSTDGNPEIVANCITSKPGYGMYSMRPSAKSMVKIADVPPMHGGAVYVNGKYYGCDYDVDYTTYQISKVTWNVYDAQTWHCESSKVCPADYSYVATDRTYDRTTGKVYSINYDKSGDALWLATVSLTDGKPTYIAPLEETVFTIAASPEGQLYGIDPKGKLWKISKTDGTLTLVGATNIYDDYETSFTQTITIDQKTGKLYWIEFHAEGLFQGASAIFEVDPRTAKAVKICDLPDGPEMMGAYVADYQAAGVPGVPQNLDAVAASTGSLNYNFSFTAPSQGANGESLGNQTLTCEITVDGDLIDIIEVEAGKNAVSGPHTLLKGLHTVKVTAENGSGVSEPSAKLFYAGWDVPTAPGNLKVSVSGTKAEISWTAPTAGANNGAIRTPISYEVIRIPDNVTIAKGISALKVSDNVTKPGRYAYKVLATSQDGTGPAAESDYSVLGMFQVPYNCSFVNENEFLLYTIVDVAGTGKIWNYDEDNRRMRHPWSASSRTDDYAVSPAFNLDGNKSYKLTFNAYQMVENYDEHVQLWHGSSPDPADMEMILDTGKLSETPTTFSAVFAPAASGAHYFAFRSEAAPNGFMSYVDDVTLAEAGASAVPAAVTDLTATGAANGELRIDLSFKAPLTTMRGDKLDAISEIEISDNDSGRVLKKFTAPAPGESLNWSDPEATQGIHNYKVLARSAQGDGQAQVATAFAGVDIPMPVSDLTLTGDAGSMILSWIAPTRGVNGGNMEGVLKFKVERVVNGTPETIADNLIDNKYTDDWDTEIQAFVYYTVTSITSAGSSDGVSTRSYAAGHPYALPYMESFTGGTPSTQPWSVEQVAGLQGSWKITSKGEDPYCSAQDSDSGMATFDGYHSWTRDCELRLVSPAIDFSDWADPKLTFWMYHFNGQGWSETEPVGETMIVEASANNEPFEKIEGANYQSYAAKSGWTEHTLDLSKYKGCGHVRIGFTGKSAGNFNMHIDNLKVEATEPYVSSVNSATDKTFGVHTEAGIIIWKNASSTVNIYDTTGRRFASEDKTDGSVEVNSGIYLVSDSEKAVKVVVK